MAFEEVGVRAVVQGASGYFSTLDRMERQGRTFGSSLGRALTIGAAAAGAALGGVGIAGIKMAADFETTMAKISGLTNTPIEQVDELKSGILDMAKTLPKSPAELGAAAYFILSSGISDTTKAMEILELSARASAVGLGETKVIAHTLTSVMNAYQLGTEDAAKATDILVNTIKFGKGEPEELAGALGFVIPIAAQMGVEFDQVGAVLATLTNTGLGAENAVTALKGIMTQLLSPADKSKEIFQALGINLESFRKEVDTDFIGAMSRLMGVISADEGGVVGALGGMDAVVAELFPDVRGLVGVMAAFGNQLGQTQSNLVGIQGGAGALDHAFAELEKTAAFKFRQAMNQLNVTLVEMGSVLLPGVVKGLNKINPILAKVLPKGAILLGKALKTVGQQIEFVADVIGALVSLGGRFVRFLKEVHLNITLVTKQFKDADITCDGFHGTMERLGLILVAIIDPIASVVTRVGALLGRIEPLRTAMDAVGDAMDKVLRPLRQMAEDFDAGAVAAHAAVFAIGALLATLVVSKVAGFLGPLKDLVTELGKLAGKVVSFTIRQVTETAGEAAQGVVGGAAEQTTEALGETVGRMVVAEMDVTHMTVTKMDVVAKTEPPPAADAAKTAEKAGSQAAGAAGKGFAQGIGIALATAFVGALVGLGTLVAVIFTLPVWAGIALVIAAALATALTVGLAVYFQRAIRDFFTGPFVDFITQTLPAAAASVGREAEAIGTAIVSAIGGALSGADSVVGNAMARLPPASAVAGIGTAIGTAIGGALSSAAGFAAKGAQDLVGVIGRALADFFTPSNLGRVVGTGLALLVGLMFPPVLLIKFRKQIAAAMGTIGEGIADFIGDLPRLLGRLGGAFGDAIGDLPRLLSGLDLPRLLSGLDRAVGKAISGLVPDINFDNIARGIGTQLGIALRTSFNVAFNIGLVELPKLVARIPGEFLSLIVSIPAALIGLPGAILGVFKSISLEEIVAGLVFPFVGFPGRILIILEAFGIDTIGFLKGLGADILRVVGEFLTGVAEGFLGFFEINAHDVGRWIASTVGFVVGLGVRFVEEVGGFLGDAVNLFIGLPGRVLTALISLPGLLVQSGRDVIQGLIDGVKQVMGLTFGGGLLGLIGSIPERFVNAIPNPLNILWDIGKQIIQGLIDGMKSLPIPNPLDLIPDPGGVVGTTLDKVGLKQHGDPHFRGGWAMVGEAGRELVKLPRGARIYSNPETEGLMGAGPQPVAAPGGGTGDDWSRQVVRAITQSTTIVAGTVADGADSHAQGLTSLATALGAMVTGIATGMAAIQQGVVNIHNVLSSSYGVLQQLLHAARPLAHLAELAGFGGLFDTVAKWVAGIQFNTWDTAKNTDIFLRQLLGIPQVGGYRYDLGQVPQHWNLPLGAMQAPWEAAVQKLAAPQVINHFAPALPAPVFVGNDSTGGGGDFNATITVGSQRETSREVERTLRRIAFAMGK